MYTTKRRKLSVINQSFMDILKEGSPYKNIFMDKWKGVLSDYYRRHGQYGRCSDNGMTGALTVENKWSYLNLFNTNYSVNIHLCEYLNKRIRNEVIAKGIMSVGGKPVSLINFQNDGFTSENVFINKEIEKYFMWMDIYGSDIFIPHQNIKDGTILNELVSISRRTFTNGTYCEVVLQYYIMLWDPSVTARRISIVRGSSDDFKGNDLYTSDRDGNLVDYYQSKMTAIYKNTIKPLDYKRYHDGGVKYFGLVDLFSSFKKRVILLTLQEDLFFINHEGKYEFTDDKIYKETVMSEFFYPDSAFYNFFLFCAKKEILFDLERNEENITKIKYEPSSNTVTAILPMDEDQLDETQVTLMWRSLIDLFDEGEVKENNLTELEKFVK